MTSSALPPAGWYPDPEGVGELRWWNGEEWTSHVHSGFAAPPVNEVVAAPKVAKKGSSWRISKLTDEEYEAGLEKRIAAVIEAIREDDVESEEGLTFHVTEYARGRRGAKGLAEAQSRLVAEKAKLGVRSSARIGVVSGEGFMEQLQRTGKVFPAAGRAIGGPIAVYADKIVQDGAAHRIDEYTQAQVYIDGQKQITTRPSLTALAIFSPLPGSALGPALARPVKETHDLRIAEFQVTGPGWSCSVALSPDKLGSPRALAARINALADTLADERLQKYNAAAPTPTPASDPIDVVAQIERIIQLEQAGSITSDQADALKTRIISDA